MRAPTLRTFCFLVGALIAIGSCAAGEPDETLRFGLAPDADESGDATWVVSSNAQNATLCTGSEGGTCVTFDLATERVVSGMIDDAWAIAASRALLHPLAHPSERGDAEHTEDCGRSWKIAAVVGTIAVAVGAWLLLRRPSARRALEDTVDIARRTLAGHYLRERASVATMLAEGNPGRGLARESLLNEITSELVERRLSADAAPYVFRATERGVELISRPRNGPLVITGSDVLVLSEVIERAAEARAVRDALTAAGETGTEVSLTGLRALAVAGGAGLFALRDHCIAE